jgi:crotonobetainyl-CoA:carnitine CoA-transferase CaiB-like acyl-CoA transferase
VVAGNNSQFRKLVQAMEIPEIADDDRFATVGGRNDRREELRPILLQALAKRSAKEWFGILSAAGVPCGPINDVQGGIEVAEELGLEPVVLAGGVPSVRNPIRFSATPARYDLAPPALDADGAAVRAWLGLPAEHQLHEIHPDEVPVPSA